MDLELSKRLSEIYARRVTVYKMRILGKQDTARFEAFEMLGYKKMLKIKWMEKIRNITPRK